MSGLHRMKVTHVGDRWAKSPAATVIGALLGCASRKKGNDGMGLGPSYPARGSSRQLDIHEMK